MSYEDFIAGGKHFLLNLLKGVCQDSAGIQIAAWAVEGRIVFAAKLSRADDKRIRYSDAGIYSALKIVMAAVASTRKDPEGNDFRATFKLYDPDMAGAAFDVPIQRPL